MEALRENEGERRKEMEERKWFWQLILSTLQYRLWTLHQHFSRHDNAAATHPRSPVHPQEGETVLQQEDERRSRWHAPDVTVYPRFLPDIGTETTPDNWMCLRRTWNPGNRETPWKTILLLLLASLICCVRYSWDGPGLNTVSVWWGCMDSSELSLWSLYWYCYLT